jgi:hypothetical protein
MARTIMKNKKKYSRALITEDDKANVTVTNPLMDVVNDEDTVIQDEAAASLDDNGTAAVTIYGLVDTTAAGFVDGEWVKARFTFTIGDEVLGAVDPIFIGEEKL